MQAYDGREDWVKTVLVSMKAELPEIAFGESVRDPVYKGLRAFCDNPGAEQILDFSLLKSYLKSAGTPRAMHYLCIIEAEVDKP